MTISTELKVFSLGQTQNTEGLEVTNSRKQGLITDYLWITKVAARFLLYKSQASGCLFLLQFMWDQVSVFWVILSVASANTPNSLTLLLGQGEKACLCSYLGPYKSALLRVLQTASAIGNNISLSGNESKIATRVIFCSHLCKQCMFNLPQRELRYDKQKLQCGFNFPIAWPEGDTLKRHWRLQKHSPWNTLAGVSAPIVQEVPPHF